MAGEDFVAAQFSVGGALPKPRELVLNFSRRTIGSVGQRRVEASHGCAQAGQRSLEVPLRSVELVPNLLRQCHPAMRRNTASGPAYTSVSDNP